MNATAVIVARFQTPYLHKGHEMLINEIKAKHHKIVIVLGISPLKGSKRNPFDFYTREKMLKLWDNELTILPLSDHPSDITWSHNLDYLLHSTFPKEQFVLYGGRQSFIDYYHGRLITKEFSEMGQHSASDIRDQQADKVLSSVDFRLGINYAFHNTYTKVYPTVDVALFRSERTELLLGRKPNTDEWRLPGGFVDATDESYEHAAQRELMEECGSLETSNMQYIGSAKIDDWRYRHEDDKILTTLFATDLMYGNASPADDLEQVQWFKVQNLEQMIKEEKIVKEHHFLIRLLLSNALSNYQTITKN